MLRGCKDGQHTPVWIPKKQHFICIKCFRKL